MNDTSSRVWLITGASRGLGHALAQRALERGDRVIGTARELEAMAPLLAAFPERARALPLDLAEAGSIAATVQAAAVIFGRLDVVVNNAGYGLIGALEELGEDQIMRNFAVNFFGAVHLTRAALPNLRAQRRGHVVMISAAAAIANYPGFAIYGATKPALEAVGEALAAEMRPLGIKVTLVEPGPFRTEFAARSLEGGAQSLPDYEGTSGKFRRLIEGTRGRQPGDPARAADAIIAAVAAENPPLRLVLGRYANDKARRTLAARSRELEAWEQVGVAADFPSAATAAR
jgi:NAD(P)-dependent dehydrogenase (short-subunit alcohol dehydrogenase family)